MEEFLFKVLCEFVWKNSCSKYCVNFYGRILVQSMCEFVWRNSCSNIQIHTILWTRILPYKFTQYIEQEFFHTNSNNTLNKNSSIQIYTYFEQEFLHIDLHNTLNKNSSIQIHTILNVLCKFVWKNSCSKYCVNLYGRILVQSIVWIFMEEFLFKVCVNLYGGILVLRL
jgi:negative regulator of genetic competence, sporulation and motility